MKKLQVGLIGGGSWGTTVASLVAQNTDVSMWARNRDTVKEINKKHTNEKYLPGAKLPKNIVAYEQIEDVVSNADVLVMGVPSNSFRDVLRDVRPHLRPWVPIVSLTKGLERGSDLRMTQIVEAELPGHPVGVLTGPNLAREIMAGQAAASVIAMDDEIIVKELQKVFNSGVFRVYTNNDVIGCELGGVLKNIIAIGLVVLSAANTSICHYRGPVARFYGSRASALAVTRTIKSMASTKLMSNFMRNKINIKRITLRIAQ